VMGMAGAVLDPVRPCKPDKAISFPGVTSAGVLGW
jgi:hypothetical protein